MSEESGGTVLVFGAGFTKAFVPTSPLLTDFYGVEDLLKQFSEFPYAREILHREMKQAGGGRIDIERLMTRLDGLMPYDLELGAEAELAVLLREVKGAFRRRLSASKQHSRPDAAVLEGLAKTCIELRIPCLTFNYDDIFDEYLMATYGAHPSRKGTYWHPDGGYGFFCRPSVSTVHNIEF